MSWNTGIILVADKTSDEIAGALPDVYEVTAERLGWESASSSSIAPDAAFGSSGGWCLIYDPTLNLALDDDFLGPLSAGGRAFCCLLHGVSSTYGICHWVDGRLRRKLLRQEFKVIEEVGEPLDEERDLNWEVAEDGMFEEDVALEVARRVTGQRLTDFDAFGATQFTLAKLNL